MKVNLGSGRKNSSAPRFLNVDLEIESKADLTSLRAELGRKVVPLLCEFIAANRFLLSLETTRVYQNPDGTIHALCSMIENLSPAGKRLWKGASKKVFDVGYERARTRASLLSLQTDTLARIARINATLAITFYTD